MKYGIECSIPYGNGAKYDFIADINGNLIRIQCKSSSPVDSVSFHFSCTSSTTNTQKTVKHNYQGLIDYFATEYLNKIYLVPVEECSTIKTLRLAPPQNGSKIWNDAKTYELEEVLSKKFGISKLIPQQKEVEKAIRIEKKYYCIDCGKEEVSGPDKRCHNCLSLFQRKVERPTREELKKMIRSRPWTSLAQEFGVSDKAIVKWCIGYGLPSKKSDIKNISDEDWITI